jgi:hypothetical protein
MSNKNARPWGRNGSGSCFRVQGVREFVVRGGSWDDDADKLRTAARRGSNPTWSIQDPDRPQSIWWHTDATFVGFRIVRPLVKQENLRGLKSQVVKGKRNR